MPTTFAELDSRVLSGFEGIPDEWLDIPAVHSAVVAIASKRSVMTRVGDTNVVLSTSVEFTPVAVLHDITTLIGKGTPIFAEIKNGNVFTPLRVVNLAQITSHGDSSHPECAFYAEEPATDGSTVQFIRFSVLPSAPVRLRFDRDAVRDSMASLSLIPDDLSELLVLEAQNKLIPKIKLKISLNMARDENDRKDAQFICSTLDGMFSQNLMEIQMLDQMWKVWAFRDRNAQTDQPRRVPSGRRLYGD